MNATAAIAVVANGVDFLKQFAPLASALGGPVATGAIKLAETLAEIATNVDERVKQGELVASSYDQDELRRMLTDIAATNDGLALAIAAS